MSRASRTSCENCQSIDIRQLHRDGYILTPQSFSISWMLENEPFGGVAVQTTREGIILTFLFKPIEAAEWQRLEQYIPVVWTACALGGGRPWFVCAASTNGVKCERRAAKIYIDQSPVFACRRCHDLAYASQFQPPSNRGIAKAMKIRMRLGGSPNLCDPFPDRPKGLHWKTYNRLRQVHDAAEGKASLNYRMRRLKKRKWIKWQR